MVLAPQMVGEPEQVHLLNDIKRDIQMSLEKKSPSLSKRIEYAKIAFAYSAHERAWELLQLMNRRSSTMGIVEKDGLSTAIVAIYMSPFKSRHHYKISKEWIPEKHRKLHDNLERVRDKVEAHRDHDFHSGEEYSPNDVEIEILPGNFARPLVYRGYLNQETRLELCDLLHHLMMIYRDWLINFVKEYLSPPPKVGYYKVDLNSESQDWLVKRDG